MNKITYCIPFLNNTDGIFRAVATLYTVSSIVPDRIVIIDNSTEGLAAHVLHSFVEKYTNLFIFPQTRNLGVSSSWNTFLRMYDDWTIVANDDVEVHEHTIDALITAARVNKEEVFFCGPSDSGNAFSFFLFKKEGFCKIGPFDETFYPAYFEDNDMAYRLRLAGYTLHTVQDATYTHEGSGTLKRYDILRKNLHHQEFRKNQAYYVEKWGGLPHEEKYVKEFNGKKD